MKGSVLVTGATGYIGSHLVAHLAQCGLATRCLVRRQANPSEVDYLRSLGAQILIADLANQDKSLSQQFEGVQTVVHLIGSIAPRRGQSLKDLHLRQTQALIDECILASVPKIVMVTALGTADGANNAYHSTKWMAEQCLREARLKHVIVRPSLVVGRQVGSRDSKLVRRYCNLIASRNRVPLIAGGLNKIQPLFIGDLAAALTALVNSDSYDNKIVELGGPAVITMRNFVEELMMVSSVDKPMQTVPAWMAKLFAFGCQIVQDVPTVSIDQVLLSTADNICRENRLESLISRKAKTLQEALQSYKFPNQLSMDTAL